MDTSSVVNLPDHPVEKEFEEYISAYLQASGFYVERNIIERDIEEVLELDLIITDYDADPPRQTVVEVKSGKRWGFPDLFKVCGWVSYLGLDGGLFVASESKGDDSVDHFYREKSMEFGIDLQIISDLNMTPFFLRRHLLNTALDDTDLETWRFAYWIERKITQKLTRSRKTAPDRVRYERMHLYHNTINNSVFFTSSLVGRIQQLYQNFQTNSDLSSRVASELSGGEFEPGRIPPDLFSESFYDCRFNDISIASYLEYRSRLAILKYAVDLILLLRSNRQDRRLIYPRSEIRETQLRLGFLPANFQIAIEQLSRMPYFEKFPLLWQWFAWFLGGFYLLDYEEEEFAFLSKRTGIPSERIGEALAVIDLLFPVNGGWFTTTKNTAIRALKLFPAPFRGNGAAARLTMHTQSDSFDDLSVSGHYTKKNLVTWNNACVDFLR